MNRPRCVASALLVGGLLATQAAAQAPAPSADTTQSPAAHSAQSPSADTTQSPAAHSASAVPQARQHARPANNSLFTPIPTDPAHPDYHPGAHRTILRHNPLPRRTSYNSHYSSGKSAGYANPGGVGRYAEYYDQNTLAPVVDYHAAPVARFDSGGGPDRADQIAAQQVGIQRARSIQDHIDAYGRPIGLGFGAGFGYGLGLAGGRGYAFPY